MRNLLLTIFWISNVGNVVQLIVIAISSWLLFSGAYTFSELDIDEFLTEIVPWLLWVKTLLIAVFGMFGEWILGLPTLIIAPFKFVFGIFIGVWAYTAAQNLRAQPANA